RAIAAERARRAGSTTTRTRRPIPTSQPNDRAVAGGQAHEPAPRGASRVATARAKPSATGASAGPRSRAWASRCQGVRGRWAAEPRVGGPILLLAAAATGAPAFGGPVIGESAESESTAQSP